MKKNSTTITKDMLAKGGRYIRVRPEIVREIQRQNRPDYVTATLPNGEEVDLYGDAVDMVQKRPDTDPAWTRLADAIREIVTNDATPRGLYNEVIDYLSSNSGDLWGELMITPPMITNILVHAKSKEDLEANNAEN